MWKVIPSGADGRPSAQALLPVLRRWVTGATPGRFLALLVLLLGLLLPGFGQAISWTGVSGATVTNLSGTTPAASNTYFNIRNAVLDGSGNIIVTGDFSGLLTLGSTTLSSSGAVTGANYIAKWNPTTSTWMWAKSGGVGATAAFYNYVAVSGNSVYVAGSFTGSADIDGTTVTSPGYNGLFLVKYTDNGSSLTKVWVKKCTTSIQQNGSGVNSVLSTCGVTVQGSSVYLAGRFVNDITVEGTAQLDSPGNGNIFLAKFSDAGTAAWAVQTGGSANDTPNDVKAGANGIYVAGSFGASTTYGGSTFTNFGSSNDICLIKFNDSNGSVGWARQEGGVLGDTGNCLFVDGSSVYLGGSFTGTTASIGGTSITNGSANSNMFVAKYLDNGSSVTPRWGIGSTANGSANTIPVDGLAVSGGMVYAVGSFNPTATIAGTNLTTVSGGTDVYVARFTDNGTSVANNGAISGGKAGASGANDGSEQVLINGSTLYLLGRTYAGATFGSATLPNNGPYGLGFIATVNLPGAPPASPTVTLTSGTVAAGGTTSTSPVSFTATFSASVTGFAGTDVTVTGGAVTSGSFSGSGTTYSFTVTPSGAGTVSVTVPAGAAQNGSANNTASPTYSFTYTLPATAAPVVTSPANGSSGTDTTPTYSGTAPNGSTVTVYVNGSSIGTVTANAGNGNWSKTQSPALADGTYTVYATAQSSGSAVSPSSNTNTFTIDNAAPTVTITSSAGPSGSTTSTSPVPFTVTFSEAVTGLAISEINVAGGTKSALTTVSSSQYTFTVTPGGAGTITVSLPANQANDAAGNGNVAASQFSITFIPTPTITALTPSDELTGMPVTITGAGFTAGSTVTFGGVAASSVTYNSPTSLTATVPAGATVGSSPVVVTTSGVSSNSSPVFTVRKVYDAVTSCLGTATYTATGDGAWHYVLAPGGDVVAALQDTRAALGLVTVSLQVTGSASAVRQDGNGIRYLDRNFRLNASGGNTFPGQMINVRFYGLTSEFAHLQAVQPGLSYATLRATQYSGPNEDCQLTNNSRGGESRTLSLAASTPGGGVPWFVAQAAVPDHFSEFYLTGSLQPLPVELVSFTAEVQGQQVQLQWRTAQEKNNARFEVERSLDGRQFAKIGEVAGQGTTAHSTDYAFLDNQVPKLPSPQEPIYYRLRQLDLDGTGTLSAVRTVTLGGKAPAGLGLTVYPQPVPRGARLYYARQGQLTQPAELTVYALTGKRQATHQLPAGATGTIATDGLPAGWYLLRLRQADGSSATARFLVE